MDRARLVALSLAAACMSSLPAIADDSLPQLAGKWVCDRAELLIGKQWTTVDYQIDITEQRGPLMKASLRWSLPKTKGVAGNQGRSGLFEGTIALLGVIDWDNTRIDFVTYGDTSRRRARLADPDTMYLVNSEAGNYAWVNRTVCRRKK